MGGLGNTLPAVIKPGWGGYTFPPPNVVSVVIATRVNPELCTLPEAYQFFGVVLAQGDVIPMGQLPSIREETQNQLYVDPAYLAAGYLPFVLEWAGPAPSPTARAVPMAGSQTVLTAQHPYPYSVNIGLMFYSAPQVPGSTGSLGLQALRGDFKLQIKADGSLSWVGLDQPTMQGVVNTSQGSTT